MQHTMKLWDSPFCHIKSGSKTIEMRLMDEKRAKIAVGDCILFTNAKTGETLTRSVKNLYVYPSFEELYRHHDKLSIGYTENEIAKPEDMLAYYSEEEIARYGVVAIELQCL